MSINDLDYDFTSELEVYRVMADASVERSESLPHALLIVPQIEDLRPFIEEIAQCYDRRIIEMPLGAGRLERVFDKMLEIDTGDILYVPNLTPYGPKKIRTLFSNTESFKMEVQIDSGMNIRLLNLNLPRFTLIAGATQVPTYDYSYALRLFRMIRKLDIP